MADSDRAFKKRVMQRMALIESGERAADAPFLSSGAPVLFALCERPGSWGHLMKRAVAAGANVDAADRNGGTALLFAVQRKQTETVRLLVGLGADANAESGGQETPLLSAVVDGSADLVAIMLQGGADPNKPVNLVDQTGNGRNETTRLLHCAVLPKISDTRILELLLGAGAAIDATDDQGTTALYRAARFGCLPVVECLLSRSADPNVADVKGVGPLHAAVAFGNLEMCEALLDAGADVDIADVVGSTAFLLAARLPDATLVRYFAEVTGADVHAASTRHGSALHLAVSGREETGRLEVLTFLLELGVYDVNEPSPMGWKPLHMATLQDSPTYVTLLLQHGADVGAGCVLGERVTPILFARSEFVEKLLRKKLRVGRCGYPLCDGAVGGGKLLGCSLCNRVFYCSKECQRADWRAAHKRECQESYEFSSFKKQPPATQAEAQAPAEAAVLLETGGQRAMKKGSSRGAGPYDSYEADRKKKLDKKTITDGFLTCEALVGDPRTRHGWVEAKVLKHWDEGNPYRLQIQNEEKEEVWAPVDSDDYIRNITQVSSAAPPQAEVKAPAEAAALLETGGQRAMKKGSSRGAVLNDSYEADRKKKLTQASAPPPPPMPPPATPPLDFTDALLLLGWDPRASSARDPNEPGFGAACLEERIEGIAARRARELTKETAAHSLFALIGYSQWRIYASLRAAGTVETFKDIVEAGVDAEGLVQLGGAAAGWCVADFEPAADREDWGSGGAGAREDFPDKLLDVLRWTFPGDELEKDTELGYRIFVGAVKEEELMNEVRKLRRKLRSELRSEPLPLELPQKPPHDRELADYMKQAGEEFEEAKDDFWSFAEAKGDSSDSSSSERDSEESKGDEPFGGQAEMQRQQKAQHHWEERSKKLVAELHRSSDPGSFLALEVFQSAERVSQLCQQVACPSYTGILGAVMDGLKQNDPFALIHEHYKEAVQIISCAEPERLQRFGKVMKRITSDPCPRDAHVNNADLAVYLAVRELLQQEQTDEVKSLGMTFRTLFKSFQERAPETEL
ncbi:hypothetical protein TeGR_g6365 [Tetraparma gracilis]|uniref:MYND-type domain-containing protein n=1 Tax=Tetraparma gracilis TaxID=2962635 RepID=A0ABQ6MBQ1_9STRA|nr:hypothetical protein TeGR_g6365 [Tetraparma gracilis]